MTSRRPVFRRCGIVLLTGALTLTVGIGTAMSATAVPRLRRVARCLGVTELCLVTGTVNPNGTATTWFFQYGPSTSANLWGHHGSEERRGGHCRCRRHRLADRPFAGHELQLPHRRDE